MNKKARMPVATKKLLLESNYYQQSRAKHIFLENNRILKFSILRLPDVKKTANGWIKS